MAAARKEFLHITPKVFVDDALMLAFIGLTFMRNLARVDRILKQGIEGTAREPLTTRQRALSRFAALAHDTVAIELRFCDVPFKIGSVVSLLTLLGCGLFLWKHSR